MNIIKEYILPALTYIFVAALIIFVVQFIDQTSWAAGMRATAAVTPLEIGDAPADLFSLLGAIGISLVKLILLIGLPATITWNVLKRNNNSK